MFARFSPGRRVRDAFGLTILLLLSSNALANNLWHASIGQSWFWETRDWSGEVLAGTWWSDHLDPGKNYQISFEVNDLRGAMRLLVADRAEITIDKAGSYSYDFSVASGGKRRMIFQTQGADVLASVNKIVVSEKTGGHSDPSGGGSGTGKNLWTDSFGQPWFYEVRSWRDEILAGTWWESALSPGQTYRISFTVTSLKGRLGVLVGGNPVVEISGPGTYSYDFTISQGGERRMLFRTLSTDVVAAVNKISVTPVWGAPREGSSNGSGNWVAKGHYVAFDRERNLKTEMHDIIKDPGKAASNYHRNVARDLDAALRTPGVKGVWMAFPWRTLEVGDGKFNWQPLDQNMEVARQYGLQLIVKVGDRSFNGTNVLPKYFPSKYVLWSNGSGGYGVVAKRWDPWVYNRTIRLYKAIANRYANHPAFGGIATTETATGYSGGDYTAAKYRHALTQIVNQTQGAMKRGRLFFYMNFLIGGENSDMNKDQRVALLRDVPHANLVLGGPDVSPDVQGMPRSVTNYRIHARKNMPGLQQFCHLQHFDQGQGGGNVKSNKWRRDYLDHVARVRDREKQSWYKDKPAVFQFDDLRAPNGNKVEIHPNWVLGKLWKLDELMDYGQRNFGCDYVLWNYREHPKWNEFGWDDVRNVILNTQHFYQ